MRLIVVFSIFQHRSVHFTIVSWTCFRTRSRHCVFVPFPNQPSFLHATNCSDSLIMHVMHSSIRGKFAEAVWGWRLYDFNCNDNWNYDLFDILLEKRTSTISTVFMIITGLRKFRNSIPFEIFRLKFHYSTIDPNCLYLQLLIAETKHIHFALVISNFPSISSNMTSDDFHWHDTLLNIHEIKSVSKTVTESAADLLSLNHYLFRTAAKDLAKQTKDHLRLQLVANSTWNWVIKDLKLFLPRE